MSQVSTTRAVQRLDSNKIEGIEVQAPPRRRVWTTLAKLQVLRDIDELKGHNGDIGAYLRQKGLYSPTISAWRKMRDAGILVLHRKRGPQPRQTTEQKELERLEKENLKLKRELEISKKLIEIQKKIAYLIDEEQ